MKLFYWFLLCVFAFPFAGCDKDDDTNNMTPAPTPTPTPTYDTAPPQVTIYSPLQDDLYLSISVVEIYAEITDDVYLDKIDLFLVSPSGERKRLDIINTGFVETNKNKTIYQSFIPTNKISGNYSILIEAKDRTGKATSKSVSIKMIGEDISKLDFKTAFMSTGWYESMGCCYSSWNVGMFNYAIYSILYKNQWDYPVDTTFVDEFGEDFGNHSRLWSKWDLNNNGYLENSELEKGLDDLGFFKQWDKNQDNLISEEELADGIGILWDVNKDNVVTAAEFERKLLKYFLY
jgi:hypothetical protein